MIYTKYRRHLSSMILPYIPARELRIDTAPTAIQTSEVVELALLLSILSLIPQIKSPVP